MILGSIQKNCPPSLCVSGNVIDTVKCFKLLGINISHEWSTGGLLKMCFFSDSDSDSVYWTCSQKAKNQKAKQTVMHCT